MSKKFVDKRFLREAIFFNLLKILIISLIFGLCAGKNFRAFSYAKVS
jgi:hypothetical protein